MSDEHYKVVLKGYTAGKGEHYIEEDLAKLFKISHEKAKELLCSAPKIIKENLSLDDAKKYKDAIDKTGAECDVDDMNYDFSGLSIE